MKNSERFKLTVIATLVVVGLAACDKQPGPAETAGKKIDQTAENAGKAIDKSVDKLGDKLNAQGAKTGVTMDDAEITTKVKAAIFAEPGLRTLQINVDTVKGVVTLTGSVDSPANKDRAQALAGAVAGVKEVRNLLVSKAGT